MKKLIVLVMLMSLMFATGFRGNAWGTTEKNIKESIKKNDGNVYTTKINGEDVMFGYYFFQGKLYKGLYACDTSKRMYDYFVSLLTSKYGEPTEQKVYDSDFNEYMSYDENILYGNVLLSSTWEVNGTKIDVIAGKYVFVTYVLPEIEEQSVKAEQAKTAELF